MLGAVLVPTGDACIAGGVRGLRTVDETVVAPVIGTGLEEAVPPTLDGLLGVLQDVPGTV